LKRLLLPILLIISFQAYSQNPLNQKMDGSEKGKNLIIFFEELESKQEVRFYFINEWLQNISFNESYEGQTLSYALSDLFLGTDLNFVSFNDHTIVIVKDPTQAIQRQQSITSAKRELRKVDKVVIGKESTQQRKSQRITLFGTVLDGKTKEPLIGANIYVEDSNLGAVADSEGKYSITLQSGQHLIRFTFVNYEEKLIDVTANEGGVLNLELEESAKVLDEVVVQDRTVREITTSGIGLTQLSLKEIKRAPALLGEVDIIKSLQTLPGVTTAGEAASGFNVRGGSVDQNLILYDGLPVFNSSHVFGFFSSFNSEAIRDVTFYRGGIPAEFGGRISSVLDIRSKEGSYQKWEGSGGIGIISSNLMLSGPIKKDKTSVAVSLRTTYSDWLINTVKSNYVDLSKSTVRFYDGTAKVTHKFNEKTKLTLSGYLSHDEFRLTGDSTYRWDTSLASLRLDHEFSKIFNVSVVGGYGTYSYNVSDVDPLSGFDLTYKLSYPSAKADFHLNLSTHKVAFGAQSTFYDFNPGTFSPSTPTSDKKFIQMDKQRSFETGFFISDQFEVTKKFFVDAGIRLSMFQAVGPGDVNIYKAGFPKETTTLVDTLHFKKGQTMKSYVNPEPRLGLRYEISPEASIKLGYNRIYQYLHLVTNTTAITPVDIWQPSGYHFKPQFADQLSLGYFRNFKEKQYEAFVEVYYKDIHNVLDFKDGAQLILNPHLESDLLQGKARAYGVEMQVAKTKGRLVGSMGYTYSRSLRTIIGAFPEETINDGKEYPSNFDQPNVVNLSWKYSISRRYFFTGGFTYRTGRPITLPLSAFSVDNFTVSSFSDRNQFRIPDYHRLDIGLVLEGSHKRKKLLDGTWTFSIYNVYARKNPYSVFFKEVRPGILRPYRLAIIGTALPSISYSFKI
jgi:hypothetical protein